MEVMIINTLITKKVSAFFDGQTITSYLNHYHLARKTKYLLIKEGILINDQKINERFVLHTNDVITFDFHQVLNNTPNAIDDKKISILYEDDDLVIVDKPYDLLVYDDGSQKDNLTGRVTAHYLKKNYYLPVLPVHRLDKETSGMIIFAKHPLSLSYLSHLFESRNIVKIYQCLIDGNLKEKKGTINRPIANDRHEQKMRVNLKGEPAITHFEVIAESLENSRLKIVIETGKKHQIRVHLSYLGHPIIGDQLYQGSKSNRLMLHFTEVSFKHPETFETFHVSSKVPF